MKIIATIEARMTSSRLPRKVMLKAAGKPMLEHLINRIKAVDSIDEIVLATTTNETDNILVELALEQEISYYRGSEDDVMARVVEAGLSVGADIIVELTGDNPVIDHGIVDQFVETFKNNQCDYLSNAIIRSYPIGMDVQVFPLKVLQHSASLTNDLLDHEHVSLHIKNHPELYKHINMIAPSQLYWPDLALTLDEADDYTLLRKIIEHFSDINPLFSCYDMVEFLRSRPDWVSINSSVRRKWCS